MSVPARPSEAGTKVRELGLHERFCVARHNVGTSPLLVYTALIDGQQHTPETYHARLRRQIAAALRRYPLLSCAVADSLTRKPYFVQPSREVQADDVLRPLGNIDGLVDAQATAESSSLPSFESIYEQVFAPNATILQSLDAGPLWQVSIIEPPSGAGSDAKDFLVVMVINHILTDGRSSASLFEHLLRSDAHNDESAAAAVVPASDTFTSTSDALIKPSLSFALGMLYTEVFLPMLPNFLRRWAQGTPSWPVSHGYERVGPSLGAPNNHKVLSFPSGTVPKLKALARRNGVVTVHPVLFTACAVASYIAATAQKGDEGRMGSDEPPPGSTGTGADVVDDDAVKIASMTAMNLRNKSHNSTQEKCTGNFVGSYQHEEMLSTSGMTADFWSSTRAYAAAITSDAGRSKGRSTLGSLSYLPDSEAYATRVAAELEAAAAAAAAAAATTTTTTTIAGDDGREQQSPPAPSSRAPTQWEHWIWGKAQHDPQPFQFAFEISNLGKISVPPTAGVKTLAWSPRPAAMSTFLDVCVCGPGLDSEPQHQQQASGGSPTTTTTSSMEHDLVMTVVWRSGVLKQRRSDQDDDDNEDASGRSNSNGARGDADVQAIFVTALKAVIDELVRVADAGADVDQSADDSSSSSSSGLTTTGMLRFADLIAAARSSMRVR